MNNNKDLRRQINGQEDSLGDHGRRAAQEGPAEAGSPAATATPGRAGKEATEDGGGLPREAEPRGGKSRSIIGGTRQGPQDGVGRPLQEEASREGKAPSAHLTYVEVDEEARKGGHGGPRGEIV